MTAYPWLGQRTDAYPGPEYQGQRVIALGYLVLASEDATRPELARTLIASFEREFRVTLPDLGPAWLVLTELDPDQDDLPDDE